MEVFLDPKAFNEENLRELFAHLVTEHPEPGDVTIVVHTEWDRLQVPAPNCVGAGRSSTGAVLEPKDKLQATFQKRKDEKAYFRFNPGLKEYKTTFVDGF